MVAPVFCSHYVLPMSAALPDPAASVPAARLSGPAEEEKAVRCRSRVSRWLREMVGIGAKLVERIGRLDASRRAYPDTPRTVDLAVVGALVARAMRWTRALQARFAAERRARAAALRQKRGHERAKPPDGELAELARLFREIRSEILGAPAPAEKPAPDDCIDGKETAEVVGQICADLGVAATLMRGARFARRIEAIAAKAQALLGGPDEAWKAPPIPKPQDDPTDEHTASLLAEARLLLVPVADCAPALVPDTG
jgi:hypothetical protein